MERNYYSLTELDNVFSICLGNLGHHMPRIYKIWFFLEFVRLGKAACRGVPMTYSNIDSASGNRRCQFAYNKFAAATSTPWLIIVAQTD